MAKKTMWTDSIGRAWPGCGFVAVCDCGAGMHTQSLLGRLRFNGQGEGVWSETHSSACTLRASEANWHRVEDQSLYHQLAKLKGEQFAKAVEALSS